MSWGCVFCVARVDLVVGIGTSRPTAPAPPRREGPRRPGAHRALDAWDSPTAGTPSGRRPAARRRPRPGAGTATSSHRTPAPPATLHAHAHSPIRCSRPARALTAQPELLQQPSQQAAAPAATEAALLQPSSSSSSPSPTATSRRLFRVEGTGRCSTQTTSGRSDSGKLRTGTPARCGRSFWTVHAAQAEHALRTEAYFEMPHEVVRTLSRAAAAGPACRGCHLGQGHGRRRAMCRSGVSGWVSVTGCQISVFVLVGC